jgi:hypothetical protein
MNLEILFSCLYNHREDIARKLDTASRKQLINYIRDALKTNVVSKDFAQFCGSKLSEFVMSEKLGLHPEVKLTPACIRKIINELEKIPKQPKPEVKLPEDKKK